MRLFTVGHSNRELEDFVALLRAHRVGTLCDVRAYPRSRRLPQFDRAGLEVAAEEAGLEYLWLGSQLGGYRKENADSIHGALEPAFRGYADHMEGPFFRAGIAQLRELIAAHPTAIMCAEKDWTHCHRRFIADYLVVIERVAVFHILDEGAPVAHKPDARARVDGQRLIYDVGAQQSLF